MNQSRFSKKCIESMAGEFKRLAWASSFITGYIGYHLNRAELFLVTAVMWVGFEILAHVLLNKLKEE